MERDTNLVFVIKIHVGQKEPDRMHLSGVRRTDRVKSNDHFVVPVYCNTVECKALRDSGSSICVVRRSSLEDKVDWTGESITILDAFERPLCLPLAKVKLWSPKWGFDGEISMTVAVTPHLKLEIILGNNLLEENPALKDILFEATPVERDGPPLHNF